MRSRARRQGRVMRVLAAAAYLAPAFACTEDLGEQQAACLQGDEGRCYRVAVRYEQGEGADEDHALYLEWMARAADLGHPVAEVIIADAYEHGGPGVERSIPQAYFWYKLAADQGNAEGYEGVRRLALTLSKDEVHGVEERVAAWEPGLKGGRAKAP